MKADRIYREQRTTIRVVGPTTLPAAGACSRTVPLPVICTSRPAMAAVSMTLRTGNPINAGTLRWPSAVMITARCGEGRGGGTGEGGVEPAAATCVDAGAGFADAAAGAGTGAAGG